MAQVATGTTGAAPEGSLVEFLKSIAVEGFIENTFRRRMSQ
jgi:hypothetical protein